MRTIYPVDHPNCAKELDDVIALVKNLKIDDLKKFHAENYGIGTISIVTVGDVDDQKFASTIKTHFENWHKSPNTEVPRLTIRAHSPKQDKKQVSEKFSETNSEGEHLG